MCVPLATHLGKNMCEPTLLDSDEIAQTMSIQSAPPRTPGCQAIQIQNSNSSAEGCSKRIAAHTSCRALFSSRLFSQVVLT